MRFWMAVDRKLKHSGGHDKKNLCTSTDNMKGR